MVGGAIGVVLLYQTTIGLFNPGHRQRKFELLTEPTKHLKGKVTRG